LLNFGGFDNTGKIGYIILKSTKVLTAKMALEEIVNKYLKIGKSTLYKKMARKSKIPPVKRECML